MDSKAAEVEDRLASIPDPVLIHILSFLPILDAVRTMLIKQFGNLWTSVPNLDLDDSQFDLWYDNDDNDELDANDHDAECSSFNFAFFKFVRNVLMRHRSHKISRFRVNISDMYYSDIEEQNLGHELDSWIDFALRRQVEVLEFNVGMVEPDELLYKLPHSEFVSDSLIELKLEFLEMKFQRRVQMGSLRILKLIRVEISDAVFREVIRGCPLLQELEIYNCSDMNELSFDAPNVEKLILDTTEHYGQILNLNCPNLRSFDFTGFVDCVEVKNLSSLLDVTFNLRCRDMKFRVFPQFMAILKTLLSAKVVSLSSEFITVLFYCMLKHLPQMLMNWKHLQLSIWLTHKHIPGLCRLLMNSPYVEELVIDIIFWQRDFLQPIESELEYGTVNQEECSCNSLKNVTVYNASMCLYPVLVHLVKTLLDNAFVLNELTIYYMANDKSSDESVLSSEQWTELSEKLPTFSKASQHVKILLL